MNENELRVIFGQADQPIVPPPDLSAQIKGDMVRELDDALRSVQAETDGLVDGVTVVDLVPRGSPKEGRNPMAWLAAVAAMAAAIFVAGVLVWDRSDESTSTADVEQRTYSRACVEFRETTMVGGDYWFEVLAQLESPDQEYLSQLAAATEALAATDSASPARTALVESARLARSATSRAHLDDLIDRLETARMTLGRTTGIPCLDNQPRAIGG